MSWGLDPPVAEGWYWCWLPASRALVPCQVYEYGGTTLYAFRDGHPAELAEMRQCGYPWWSEPIKEPPWPNQ